jgi:hypothetical protein
MLKRVDKANAFDEMLARQQIDPRPRRLRRRRPARPAGAARGRLRGRPCRRRGAEVLAVVHHVTERAAGFGAVRDVVEELLRARGAWDDVVRRYGGREAAPAVPVAAGRGGMLRCTSPSATRWRWTKARTSTCAMRC